MIIPFNKPPIVSSEFGHMQQAMANGKLCGDGVYTKKCEHWIENRFNTPRALLTPSCTASLEMAAILLDIKLGDEIIMPSYTFVSTANAFALRGARIVFVDIRQDTMNIDESKIEAAITSKTKAIVPVHYAGVACEMDTIMALAQKYKLWVVEDAAQGVMAFYKGKALGTIGHIGCYSFHETKNYTSGGEGGAILINDKKLINRAEIIREKGTNRSQFFRGEVDKYTWRDLGSSYLMSDLQAAYLYAQLEQADQINEKRLYIWNSYYSTLKKFSEQGLIQLPQIPLESKHNAHMFYLKFKSLEQRTEFIQYLKSKGILSVFHYVPLHLSPAGKEFGIFSGKDEFTTLESEKLVRLPLFYNLIETEISTILSALENFFKDKGI